MPDHRHADADAPGLASQSPSDAEEDGIVAELAAVPFQVRVERLAEVASEEGTWILSRPTEQLIEASMDNGCGFGDLGGSYPTDVICTLEYGEVLLVEEPDRILKAFPMPGAVPTWVHIASDSVYAGRVGDGAQPHSVIARIDRQNLDHVVAVFPAAPEQHGEWHPSWLIADEIPTRLVEDMLRPGDASAEGEHVVSTTGELRVDLEAVDAILGEVAG